MHCTYPKRLYSTKKRRRENETVAEQPPYHTENTVDPQRLTYCPLALSVKRPDVWAANRARAKVKLSPN